MPAPNHGRPQKPGKNGNPAAAAAAAAAAARIHGGNAHTSTLSRRLAQMDPSTLTMGAHLLVLLASLLSGLFGFRWIYKIGLVVMGGMYGKDVWGAWKRNGRKVGLELAKEPAMPPFILTVLLWWFTQRPLFPLQLTFALHAALGLFKTAVASPVAASHPGFKLQTAQMKEALRMGEPVLLGIASHLELLAVPWSVLSAVSGSQGLLLPVFVLQYVRFLQLTQVRMQRAWAIWLAKGVTGLSWAEKQPGLPSAVRAVLLQTQAALSGQKSTTVESKTD